MHFEIKTSKHLDAVVSPKRFANLRNNEAIYHLDFGQFFSVDELKVLVFFSKLCSETILQKNWSKKMPDLNSVMKTGFFGNF